MNGRFPCGSIDRTKFGAIVWQDSGAIKCSIDGEKFERPPSHREVMLAAFFNFDDAVNYAIEEQEKADASCLANGYTNQGKIWAERTSGNTLVGDH
jgi:hypothetical protein